MGELESFGQRVVRHLKGGELDLETLKRGARQLAEQIELLLVENNIEIGNKKTTRDICGVSGTELTTYEIKRRIKSPFKRVDSKRATDLVNRFNEGDSIFIDFPPDCVPAMAVSTKPTSTSREVYLTQNAIGYFTGPTTKDGAPNNGILTENKEIPQIAFGETDPPGQRRGAIAFLHDGSVQVCDDATKWDYVRDPTNIKALVGTAYYLTSDDEARSSPVLTSRESYLTHLSYLICFEERGESRYGFMSATNNISRMQVLQILKKHYPGKFIAVELEYFNHNAGVINTGTGEDHELWGDCGFDRHDHYFMLPKTQKLMLNDRNKDMPDKRLQVL